jgi:hypothetical protein
MVFLFVCHSLGSVPFSHLDKGQYLLGIFDFALTKHPHPDLPFSDLFLSHLQNGLLMIAHEEHFFSLSLALSLPVKERSTKLLLRFIFYVFLVLV